MVKVYKKKKNLNKIIKKRYTILLIIIFLVFTLLLVSLFKVQIIDHTKYVKYIIDNSVELVEGSTAPRGRIYDRNHKLLVDNKAIKKVAYKKISEISTKKEIEMSYLLADIASIDYSDIDDDILKNFFILNNNDLVNKKITKKEYKLLEERKITNKEIEQYKIDRITEEELNSLDETDKEAAYIYYLMNNGYSYDEKIIVNDCDEKEYATIAENLDNLPGFITKIDWERYYPYGDVFKTILGYTTDGLPYELVDYYLDKGYNYNDRVGASYLEYQYEDLLKGEKNIYRINSNGSYELYKPGKRGKDLVLTIDIDLQKAIEDILTEQVVIGKKTLPNSYYNRSFVVIQDPNTGEVIAMAGKQVVVKDGKYKVYDYTPGVFTTPVVPGSIVKGASHIVGYNNNAIKIGEIRYDTCLKIQSTPEKCSYSNLGYVNDLDALALSSNVYQFYTAINVGKSKYIYNGPLNIDENAFDIYRNTFKEFGLGTLTEIDLPYESTGYKGSNREPGHLLDFAIGQYDNYTPIQLSQYFSTLANSGTRYKTHILKSVYEPTSIPLTKLKYEIKPTVLNKVNTESVYMDRVRTGLREVMTRGTGYSYVDSSFNAAGKTGTSESFIDTNSDGIVDTETTTNTFGAYAPFDNPTVSFVVVSPDVGYFVNNSERKISINQQISYLVSKKYFEIYK